MWQDGAAKNDLLGWALLPLDQLPACDAAGAAAGFEAPPLQLQLHPALPGNRGAATLAEAAGAADAYNAAAGAGGTCLVHVHLQL